VGRLPDRVHGHAHQHVPHRRGGRAGGQHDSAYGGIRWESGLGRQFQYERTQSRLGGSLWEMPMRYIENSPLFWLDKVETPLLIMHNDNDGAVPFQQGVELYLGLRRLGKPAWLINYNDEPHWPTTLANKRDWNIRMQQFFDHYLLDAPAPPGCARASRRWRRGGRWDTRTARERERKRLRKRLRDRGSRGPHHLCGPLFPGR
jgi:hypothetical protein